MMLEEGARVARSSALSSALDASLNLSCWARMSAPQLEDLFRLALSLGIPADEVSRARQDPALLMEMATRLRAAQPPAGPAKPLTSKDALDKSIEQITAARERALEEQKRPQRHPPAADRFATIKLAERMRRDLPRMYASQAEGQFTWNFMGLPKSSSNVPLDQLKPSASSRAPLAPGCTDPCPCSPPQGDAREQNTHGAPTRRLPRPPTAD